MKIIYIALLLVLILLNCSLIEPSCLLIKNKSKYTIIIKLDNGNKKKLKLEKDQGDNILLYDNKVTLTVYIESIGFSKDYSISFNYLEKKEFIFSIDE